MEKKAFVTASNTPPLLPANPFPSAGLPSPKPERPDRMYYPKPAGFDERAICGAAVYEGIKEHRRLAGYCAGPVSGSCNHCGAWSITRGYACSMIRMKAGIPRCHMHGGKSLQGAANPAFKNGGRSKHLPKNLRKHYEAYLDDPGLLTCRDGVALMQLRVDQLMQRLDTPEAGATLIKIRNLWNHFLAANQVAEVSGKDEHQRQVEEIGNELNEVITKGASVEEQWEELHGALSKRSALALAEIRRQETLHTMIPVEQVIVLMTMVADAAVRNVSNPEERNALAREIQTITGKTWGDLDEVEE